MKRFLPTIFIMLVLTAVAWAGVTNFDSLTLSGDLIVGDDATIADDCAIGGDVAITGALTVTGTVTTNGKILTAAADEAGGVTVPASASGTHYVLTGSTNETFTLPAAAAGLNYGFVVGSTGDLKIDVQSGDQIQILTNAAGDSITNTTAGGGIYLFAVDDTDWYAGSQNGTWSDTN